MSVEVRLYDPFWGSIILKCPQASNVALTIAAYGMASDMSIAWFCAKSMLYAAPGPESLDHHRRQVQWSRC